MEREYESVGEMSDESYLCAWEALMMERGDLCEVSQVPGDSAFRVIRLLLNLAEGICLEIQIKDLRLMRESRAHVVLRPTRHDEIAILFQGADVAFHRRRTRS